MSFISFLNDLGIIPNKGTSYEKNASLNQGQEFMDFNRMHKRSNKKISNNMQKTCLPGVTTIVENMENMSSSKMANKKRVTALEKEFNKTIAEYDVVYRQFSEQIIKSNKHDREIKKYFDEIITSGDGNYSYVNDYGFTQKYSKDAWADNAENCPNDPMSVTKTQMSKFQKGADIGLGQPCNVAGKNIQNEVTKEYAWVDIKGKKHIYSDKLWKKKNETCNIPSISLTEKEYNAIPRGGNMTSTDECQQLKVDPKIMQKMTALNNKIEKLAKDMLIELDDLAIEDMELNMVMNDERAKLNNYIHRISEDKIKLNQYNTDYGSVIANDQDTQLRKTSNYMHFVAWMFLVITIFSLLLHTFINPRSNTIDNFVVVIGLVFIFVICRAIYNKYYYLL